MQQEVARLVAQELARLTQPRFATEPPTTEFAPLRPSVPLPEQPRVAHFSERTSGYRTRAEQAFDEVGLTPQERAIGVMVLQGLSNDEISDAAEISTKTVKHHVGNIFKKFRVKRREQLFARVFPV